MSRFGQSFKFSQTPARSNAASKNVALLIETSTSYGRGLLYGIATYNREHDHWSTSFQPHGLTDVLPAWFDRWRGDGILARIETPEAALRIQKLGLPTVNLRGTLTRLPFPYVSSDNEQIANLAFSHFHERGLKNFATCQGPRGVDRVLDECRDDFASRVERAGMSCADFPNVDEKADWDVGQQQMADWIRKLERPVGILAGSDEIGLRVLDACRRADVAVPDQVAVLGVDNDETVCELAIPPLSSVDINAERVGYEAAQLLDQMMSGQHSRKKRYRLAPRDVVVRRSTDVIASEDDDVNRALRHIRETACKRLKVAEVLNHTSMSRGVLQPKIKQMTGLTLHQHIQRARVARAQQLLLISNKTIKQIARETGFATVQYLTRVFRAITGETPARYRTQHGR